MNSGCAYKSWKTVQALTLEARTGRKMATYPLRRRAPRRLKRVDGFCTFCMRTHVVLESSPTTAGQVPRAEAKTAAEDSESEANQPFWTLALVVPGYLLKDDEEEEDGDKKMVPAKAATKKATDFGLSRSLSHKFQTIRPQPRQQPKSLTKTRRTRARRW